MNIVKSRFAGRLLGVMLIITLLMLFTAGCGENNESEDTNKTEEQNENAKHGEKIKLTDSELKEFGIEVREAGPGVIKTHIDLAGEIRVEPSRLSHIIPRFSGIVKEVYKTVGEKVEQGDVLALIESNESLTTYEVHSLIEGTIIELHMAKGDLVGGDKVAITVANLDMVWATFNIYQKDLNKIRVGQKARVSVGSKDVEETGTISYVSPIVDERTRTASARVILNNQTGKWMPGMFITAKVYIGERKYPIVVEKSAIQNLEGRSVIFVKDDDVFKPQAVKIGNENDDNVEIISGINAGDQYVSKNSFILKAEILKESFGGGRGH